MEACSTLSWPIESHGYLSPWRAVLLQVTADDGGRLGDFRGEVTAAVFDVERRLSVWAGVELDLITLMLVADEVDVVVVCGVSDLQALDDQLGYPATQLIK